MKTDCPHCGKRIRWWHYVWGRPVHGERKFLPNRAVTVCPLCKGGIEQNTHPLEKHIHLFILVPVAIALGIVMNFQIGPENKVMWVIFFGLVFLLMSAAMVYFYIKTKNWQRFRRYGEAP